MIHPDLYAQNTLTSDPDDLEEDEEPVTADADALLRFLGPGTRLTQSRLSLGPARGYVGNRIIAAKI
jgi:hypothetical protein